MHLLRFLGKVLPQSSWLDVPSQPKYLHSVWKRQQYREMLMGRPFRIAVAKNRDYNEQLSRFDSSARTLCGCTLQTHPYHAQIGQVTWTLWEREHLLGMPMWTIPANLHRRPWNNVRWLLNLNTGIAQTTTLVANEQRSKAIKLIYVYLLIFERCRLWPRMNGCYVPLL